MFTIAIPPALPLILSISPVFSATRLNRQKIFTTSPQRINLAGKVNKFCFDKTGTLTEDFVAMHGVIPINSNQNSNEKLEFGEFGELSLLSTCKEVAESADEIVMEILASTQSVVKVNGEILGYPVDVAMLKFTKWVIPNRKI